MKDSLHTYFDIIVSQRHWSWALVALGYVFVTLTIRGWFLNILFRRSRRLDKKTSADLKHIYISRALLGWFFYLLSLALVILVWYKPFILPSEMTDERLLKTSALCFTLTLLIHLQAFALAAISLLPKSKES